MAADIPVYMEPVAPAPIVAPAPLWTGLFVGGQIGYAFDGHDDDNCFEGTFFGDGPSFDCDDFDFDDDDDDSDGSFFAGLHLGYDYQWGDFVFGGVVDVNGLFDHDDDDDATVVDLDEFAPILAPPILAAAAIDEDDILLDDYATIAVEQFGGIDWFGTARVRAGYAMGRVLFYGTGGLAFGGGSDGGGITAVVGEDEPENLFDSESEFLAACDFDSGLSDTFGEDVYTCELGDDDDDDIRFGWALGAGVEVMATDNFKIGVEYLYVNLGGDDDHDDIVFNDGTRIEFDDNGENDFHTISVRGSYRFNFGG